METESHFSLAPHSQQLIAAFAAALATAGVLVFGLWSKTSNLEPARTAHEWARLAVPAPQVAAPAFDMPVPDPNAAFDRWADLPKAPLPDALEYGAVDALDTRMLEVMQQRRTDRQSRKITCKRAEIIRTPIISQ